MHLLWFFLVLCLFCRWFWFFFPFCMFLVLVLFEFLSHHLFGEGLLTRCIVCFICLLTSLRIVISFPLYNVTSDCISSCSLPSSIYIKQTLKLLFTFRFLTITSVVLFCKLCTSCYETDGNCLPLSININRLLIKQKHNVFLV